MESTIGGLRKRRVLQPLWPETDFQEFRDSGNLLR